MIDRVGAWARGVVSVNPWTNVYGLARTIVAAATALTLATTPSAAMWSPYYDGATGPLGCDGLRGAIGLFCIVPPQRLAIVHVVSIVALAIVASGWRPRWTGVVHWWITFSVLASATRDGGEQVAALFALLAIPWTLTDTRTWHWQRASGTHRPRAAFVAHASRSLVRVQVMAVYLHSAITKFEVHEWLNGTAFYYWVHDPIVGAPPALAPVVFPLVRNQLVLAVLTYGAIVAECVLVAALIAPARWRWPLYWVGLVFHVGVALVLGIFSFSLAMIGALIVYLRPVDSEFRPPARLISVLRRSPVAARQA